MAWSTCPQCNSENTQAIHVMVAAGNSSGFGSSSHVGITSHGTIGVGSSSHGIQTATDLARQHARPQPPKRDTAVQGCGALILGAGALMFGATVLAWKFTEQTTIGIFIMLFGGFVLYLYQRGDKAHFARLQQYRDRLEYWENAWLCHRCGHDWDPRQ